MNRILNSLLVFLILFNCTAPNPTKEISNDITEITLVIKGSMTYADFKTNIKKNSENQYSYIETNWKLDSLKQNKIEEVSCNISKNQFDSIVNLLMNINEQNIKKQKESIFLDGTSYNLMFGNGINFKHYEIQNPFSIKRQRSDLNFVIDQNYLNAIRKINSICK